MIAMIGIVVEYNIKIRKPIIYSFLSSTRICSLLRQLVFSMPRTNYIYVFNFVWYGWCFLCIWMKVYLNERVILIFNYCLIFRNCSPFNKSFLKNVKSKFFQCVWWVSKLLYRWNLEVYDERNRIWAFFCG